MEYFKCRECDESISLNVRVCSKCGYEPEIEVSYHDNGLINILRNYQDGKLDGQYLSWNESGEKYFESCWERGVISGLYTEWYSNGKKFREDQYRDGNIIISKVWKPNEEICRQSNLVDGSGQTADYNEKGYMWRLRTYHNSTLNGLTSEWFDNGKKHSETIYKNGDVVSMLVWKPNGEVCNETKVEDGEGSYMDYRHDMSDCFPCYCMDGQKVFPDHTGMGFCPQYRPYIEYT